MKFIVIFITILFLSFSSSAFSRVIFSPYYSVKSSKSIKLDKVGSSTENAVNKQREEYGIRFGLKVGRFFKTVFSVGKSTLTVTEKTQDAIDEFDEIDYEKDLNMNTDNGDVDVKTTDEIINARVGVAFDPSFWIFIFRTKLGVQANKRKMTLEQTGFDPQVDEPPITYKPYAGAGLGVKLGRRMFFLVEYAGYFYKFPDVKPFQREVSVSYGISFGSKR